MSTLAHRARAATLHQGAPIPLRDIETRRWDRTLRRLRIPRTGARGAQARDRALWHREDSVFDTDHMWTGQTVVHSEMAQPAVVLAIRSDRGCFGLARNSLGEGALRDQLIQIRLNDSEGQLRQRSIDRMSRLVQDGRHKSR